MKKRSLKSSKKPRAKRSVKKRSKKKYIKSGGNHNKKIPVKTFNIHTVGEDHPNKISGLIYDNKFIFRINKNDTVIQKALQKGYLYEKYNTMILNSYVFQNDVIVDVGANVGTMTIPLSKMVPDGMVHAFEPFNDTFGHLKWNVKKNKCKNVKTYKNAVGHIIMETHLSDKIINKYLGTPDNQVNKVLKQKEKGNLGTVALGKNGQKTKMITLDSLNLDKLDILKVDVEGAEPLVFYGAQETIRRTMPIILFEQNYLTVTQDMIEEMDLPEEVVNFNIADLCQELGYTMAVESDFNDFILFPPLREKLIDDPKVVFKKQKINKPWARNFKTYKFLKPRWY
jgi:FkbM family methyltransferase